MPLNQDFTRNPGKFIVERVILVPGGLLTGEGRFNLEDNGNASCLLQGSREPSGLRAFYVKPEPNSNNDYRLSTQVDFMFTDLLNGCQFMAYGQDRHNVTVEHNNFIENPALYAQRLVNVQQQEYQYSFFFRPTIDYKIEQGICLIGTHDQSMGWEFWVRYRVDLNRGTLAGPF